MSLSRTKILFVQKISGTPTIIGRKGLKDGTSKITFRKKTWDVDLGNPIYRRKKTIFYMIDVEAGQISSSCNEFMINPLLQKAVFKDELARQLTSALTKTGLLNVDVVSAIILIALGLFGGLFVGVTFL